MWRIIRTSSAAFALLLLLPVVLLSIPLVTVDCVTETIVVPDDYLTIQDAINNAPEGAIIFVKKGTYSGPVNETIVINKTISLVGEDPQSTILNLYPAWICKFDASNFPFYEYDWALNVQADDVELSNFTINSIGVDEGAYMLINGNNTQLIDNILNLKLVLKGSNEIIVQNNLTVGLVGYDSFGNITKNTIIGYIMIELSGISYTVNDNTVADGSGIIIGGWGNIVFNNTITNCSSGLNLGGYASNNIAYANKAINNTIGIKITTRGNNNILYANYVANNQYGVDNRYIYQLGNNTLFYHNNFVDNIEQVNIDTTFPYVGSEQWTAYHSGVFDNDSEGNYWSNYNGTDNNDDGIGDTPFVIDENRQDNYPLMEPFVLSGYYIHEEVPEFPAWLILPILLSVATVAFFYKQKLSKTPNWR